ncbi:MAG: 16S rRNA (cytosine(1402)-N(4))-methyltransferase RsmH, partial [Akkermansiaceae bacterium]|nr:16S rRNA (cytosine(1402)-N(4))-methyltransferase RsmH [Akkermansiaceae bacterium]
MLLPSPTPAPLMVWCLANYSTKLLAVSGLGHPFLMSGEGMREGGGGDFHHRPVMLEEALHYLAPGAGRTVVDATLGGAGHTLALLQRGARVIGIERDPEALACVQSNTDLQAYGEAFESRRANFAEIQGVVSDTAPDGVDGILLDLGVSSHQLDTAERGFSLRADGPLDMRMDPGEQLTAAVVVNTWGEADLARIFHELGEEKRSRAVARAIVARRASRPFERTLDLAGCVAGVVGRGGRIHPATRVFQAIRMTVNRELESLQEALACVQSNTDLQAY